MADVRDAMNKAEAKFPDRVREIFDQRDQLFRIPDHHREPDRSRCPSARWPAWPRTCRTGSKATGLRARSGHRRQPRRDARGRDRPAAAGSYNVTAGELINVVQNNNQLIAAGELRSRPGHVSASRSRQFRRSARCLRPAGQDERRPHRHTGRLATINLTFEDRTGTARFNGEKTLALQVVKRKGFNLIDTADAGARCEAAAEERLARTAAARR